MDWQIQMRRIATGWLFGDLDGARLPPAVVLPLENPDLHDHGAFVSRLEGVRQYQTVAVGTFESRPVAVLNPKLGAPAVAMAVEAAAAVGARVIVGVGFCGGLQEHVACGDLVLGHACVRDDGTTAQYVPAGYPAVADRDLLAHIERSVTTDRRVHCGLLWSTDAILMETTEKVRHWSSRGCLGVDLESGSLYTVARLVGVRTCSILVASDNPIAGTETTLDTLRAGCADAISLALRAATSFPLA